MSSATNLPVQWTATDNIAWKMEIPGSGWSSPVLANGKLYLTSAVHEGSKIVLHALCLNSESGAIEWNVPVLNPEPSQTKQIHQKNSLASPTAIVESGKVYVHFGHMGTAALDLSGEVLWTQTSLKYHPVHGNGASPILYKGLLIFSCDGASDPFLAALDANSGEVKWKTPRNTHARSKFSFATPLVIQANGRDELISPTSGFVGSYDPLTGKEFWRVRYGEGYSVIPRPVFAHGLLFLSSGYDRPAFYAIRPEGASGDATDTHIAWKTTRSAPNTPSAIVVEGEVYMVSDGGVATCMDAKTGKVHWNERLGGDFSASPIAAEGLIYFQNEAGLGTVIQAGKEYKLLSKNDLAERSLASYAAEDNAIYIRTASHLWKIVKK